MSDYADFYVIVATLSPAFLAAGLLADYRLARQEPTRLLRTAAHSGLACNVVLTIVVLIASLMALAGFREEHEGLRGMLIGSVLLQFVLSAAYPVIEARRDGLRRRAKVAVHAADEPEVP